MKQKQKDVDSNYKPPFLEIRQVSVFAIRVASRFDSLVDHLVFF